MEWNKKNTDEDYRYSKIEQGSLKNWKGEKADGE